MKNVVVMPLLCLFFCLCTISARAQWVVTDPLHIAETVIDLGNQVAQFKRIAETVQEIRKISDAINKYKKINDIINRSKDITYLYTDGLARITEDKHFTIPEIQAIVKSYKIMLNETTKTVEDLTHVTASAFLSMEDGQRFQAINDIYNQVNEHYALVKYFTDKIIAISVSRSQSERDMAITRALYGIGSNAQIIGAPF